MKSIVSHAIYQFALQIMSENCHFSVEWSSTANQYLSNMSSQQPFQSFGGIRHFKIFKNMNGI